MRYLLFILLISSNVFAGKIDPTTYIPKNATSLIPVLNSELDTYWSEHQYKHYFPGLIEHESCISLTSSRCFTPSSKLLTSREEGAGLGQLTRTFKTDGSIRIDSLTELVKKHRKELAELSWGNVYSRPDLQIRGIILKSKDDYSRFVSVKDELTRLKLTDASYNQGLGRTLKELKLCSLKKGCDPSKWENGVALMCTATDVLAVYGNRTGCQISRGHVDDVFNTRMDKYKNLVN